MEKLSSINNSASHARRLMIRRTIVGPRASWFDYLGRVTLALRYAAGGLSFVATVLLWSFLSTIAVSWYFVPGELIVGILEFGVGMLALTGRVWPAAALSALGFAGFAYSVFSSIPSTSQLLGGILDSLIVVWFALRVVARRTGVAWPANVTVLALAASLLSLLPGAIHEFDARFGDLLVAGGDITQSVDRDVGDVQFEGAGGEVVRLDVPGKVYLVDFWGDGCAPCIAELPELMRLHQSLSRTGRFELVSVVIGTSRDSLIEFTRRPQVPRGLAIVADVHHWARRLGVRGVPSKFLVRDGHIVQCEVGARPDTYEHWKALIEQEWQRERRE